MIQVSVFADIPVLFAQGVSMHSVVVPAFFIFLAFQLYLYMAYRQAVGRERNSLKAFSQDGSLPEPVLVRDEVKNDWPSWVVTRFHNGTLHDGHYSRVDVLEQLDAWLESNGHYLLLQRMGIMAPLFGLLITVSGFFFLEPATSESGDLKQILYTLTPLVLGVGTGASLAIINQLLLHFAGKGTDSVRLVARNWFDDCVWRLVRTKPEEAANDTIEAFKAMAESIRGSVKEYHAATSDISQTAKILQAAGGALLDTVERLRADTSTIPEEMKSLRSTATSVIRSLGDIVPTIEKVTTELAESVEAFRSVAQVQFGQAADRQLKAAEVLAGSVDHIRESTADLAKTSNAFKQMVDVQIATSQEWSRSLQDNVIPTQRSFQQAGTQLTEAANDLSRQLTIINKTFGEDLVPTQRTLREAVDAIRSLPLEVRAILQRVTPNNNGNGAHKRSFLSRVFGRYALRDQSNHNGAPRPHGRQ